MGAWLFVMKREEGRASGRGFKRRAAHVAWASACGVDAGAVVSLITTMAHGG